MTGPSVEQIAAYRATRYDVRLPGGARATLRVGAPPPDALAHWLAGEVYTLITAHNPRSTVQPPAINRTAQHRLLHDLRAAGARLLAGVGRGEGWREASFAADGIDVATIDALARRYAQHAVLVGRGDAPVELRVYG